MKKKLIFAIIILFVASFMNAQTVSGYFTETTKPLVNNELPGQTSYHYGVTAAVGAGDTTYSIASKPFSLSATKVRNSFMGSKIAVGINITVGFADVVASLVTQISYDGTNWITYETLDSDTTPNVTGVQSYIADFSLCKAPFARLLFNSNTLQINKTGRIAFMYAAP